MIPERRKKKKQKESCAGCWYGARTASGAVCYRELEPQRVPGGGHCSRWESRDAAARAKARRQ